MTNAIAPALILAAMLPEPALASSSAWQDFAGGSIRLVTNGAPDDAGIIRGALQIDLKPGWKTYWVDPGDAGVPPTMDVSTSNNIASASMSFPAPHRFDDGFAKWAGYDEPVSFPIAFALADAGQPAAIEAKVFLGICETICIPAQATLDVDPSSDPDNADDAAVVQAALDALPGDTTPDFSARLVAVDKDAVTIEAKLPGEPAGADFFLAGAEGYQFGPPERRDEGGRLLFSVPILQQPDKAPDKGALQYTLTGAAGAVSGTIPLPLAQR